ncbi:hypothetical protein RFI_11256 [Reticulomyxa filosa]|uniref:Uncharacterized protein n=1 Tax=Reticulomyxa filosa TaxID=46433 RepID=X6NKL5_RETFI|nr:hypothetical protein RFI_11256 [Reticulomyxa filosa]|eukprot:ETO25882.1 hypothetical protein RFI_11256 [Reticulomyxa filosa]
MLPFFFTEILLLAYNILKKNTEENFLKMKTNSFYPRAALLEQKSFFVIPFYVKITTSNKKREGKRKAVFICNALLNKTQATLFERLLLRIYLDEKQAKTYLVSGVNDDHGDDGDHDDGDHDGDDYRCDDYRCDELSDGDEHQNDDGYRDAGRARAQLALGIEGRQREEGSTGHWGGNPHRE